MIYTYWKWDKAISKEYCETILNNIDWDKKEEAKINNIGEISSDKRKTSIVWEDRLSVIGCIADSYIREANVNGGWNYDITITTKIQIGKYSKDCFYDWHSDQIELNNPRKLSFVLLLNDPNEFKGGKFEFQDLKDQPSFDQGTILVFPSYFIHRVMPVIEGNRISAVTWMHGPNFK